MRPSLARPFIFACGALMAIFDLIVLLPGNPDFTSRGWFVVGVVTQALLIHALLHHSNIAWFVTVIFASLYALSVFLFQPSLGETTLLLTWAAVSMLVVVLCTPPVLAYIFRGN